MRREEKEGYRRVKTKRKREERKGTRERNGTGDTKEEKEEYIENIKGGKEE